MWIKYAEEKPKESGNYLIVYRDAYTDDLIYSVGRYETDLEKTGWHCDDGNEGFFDQYIDDGSLYMINPIAWKPIEDYEE